MKSQIFDTILRTNIKPITFALICLINLSLSAQKTNYNGGVAYAKIFNDKSELLREIPMGQDALLDYDEFYDSYNIMMNTQDGMMGFDLRYIKTDVNGKIYQDKSNTGNNRFYVIDNLASPENTFVLYMLDKQESNGQFFTVLYQFSNFKKNE